MKNKLRSVDSSLNFISEITLIQVLYGRFMYYNVTIDYSFWRLVKILHFDTAEWMDIVNAVLRRQLFSKDDLTAKNFGVRWKISWEIDFPMNIINGIMFNLFFIILNILNFDISFYWLKGCCFLRVLQFLWSKHHENFFQNPLQ